LFTFRCGSASFFINQLRGFQESVDSRPFGYSLFHEHQQLIEQAQAEKLQASAKIQCNKDAYNFLVPPPVGFGQKKLSSLSSFAEMAMTFIK
jgi:hypothetical protein